MSATPRRSWLTPFTHLAVAAIALFAPRLLPAQVPAPATKPAEAPAAVAAPTQVERPLLWRIELAPPSYLFGTIHLPDERVTDLPPVVADVLDRCDALYTELPMPLAYLMKQMDGMQLPKGATLRGALGDELYDEVAAHVQKKGVAMALLDRLQPWALAIQLGMLAQIKDLATKQALDMAIYQRAKRAGKQVGGVETMAEQTGVFADMTPAEQRTFVRDSLADFVTKEAAGLHPTEDLLRLYLRGDEAAIDARINDFPLTDAKLKKRLMTRLIDDRNVAMAGRIVRKLQEAPECAQVFAVGAAHYPGKMGVLELLRQRGYRITRLELAADDAARAAEAAAVDTVIADRQREIEALRARRAKLAEAAAR
ncbi:MAG: TraB/GumN family protein [Planctomycetes bacterium]|nr:TraB/GumN family protein [Planctomycetota bacterium]